MIKISFFNQKGGPGKTTSVVNIGAALAKYLKKRVLIIDCDSQRTATKYLLTYTEGPNHPTIDDYFSGCLPAKEVVVNVLMESKGKLETTNLYCISSCTNIETIAMKDVTDVKEMLLSLEDKYDYCLFDLPPHISGISLSALVASDYIIVPAHADTDSLSGYNDLIDTVNMIREKGWNISLNILGVIFNDVNCQRITQRSILDSCKESMKGIVFETHIKSASVIEQARFFGKPIPYYVSSNSPIGSDYLKLAKEIVKRIKNWRNNNG